LEGHGGKEATRRIQAALLHKIVPQAIGNELNCWKRAVDVKSRNEIFYHGGEMALVAKLSMPTGAGPESLHLEALSMTEVKVLALLNGQKSPRVHGLCRMLPSRLCGRLGEGLRTLKISRLVSTPAELACCCAELLEA
jgi:hypothetical protein